MPTFRSTRKDKKCFCDELVRLSDHKVLHNITSSLKFFFDVARIFSLFSLVFRTSNFWSLRNLMKGLFHSRLLDVRLVIANSAQRVTISYPTRVHGIQSGQTANYSSC